MIPKRQWFNGGAFSLSLKKKNQGKKIHLESEVTKELHTETSMLSLCIRQGWRDILHKEKLVGGLTQTVELMYFKAVLEEISEARF